MMGDQALIQVSAAIRNAVRSRDIVARFGGEEFMVLLTNSTTEAASLAAERIRQQVYDLKIPHMFNESVATNVTISIGMTPLMDSDIDGALKEPIRRSTKPKARAATLFSPVDPPRRRVVQRTRRRQISCHRPDN